MKIKMLEHFQSVEECATDVLEGFRVKALGKDMEYVVDEKLGRELIENRKAEEVKPRHYGGQAEAELRHDGKIYEAKQKPRRRTRKESQ